MQQGEGSKSQYGEISPMMGMESEQGQLVEAASPISSRPPASAAVNLDELMPLQGGGVATDEDALAVVAGDEADRAGTVGGGNRWPRQETLTLLRIRSEMDAAFRDATLKGPLWEDVSRKLAELGYKRSAKKCKEKFENVHKYYKRTKEGRAGRQDGKSYKFFSELEALHSSAATSSSNASAFLVLPPPATATNPAVVAPVSSTSGIGIMSNPMPVSSVRVPQAPPPPGIGMFPPDPSAAAVTTPSVYGSGIVPPPALERTTSQLPTGISFSSNSSSSSPGTDDDDDDDDEEEEESLEGEPSNVGSSRKRKRRSKAGSSGTRRMMQFFENLMKQVMHKQKVMQERFLEAIEKREHDRMIREEAWKRQEMARLAREHELMAQDRAISASRDAAIVTFLQNITGQTIQLPTPVTVPVASPPPMSQAPIATPTPPAPTPPPPSQSQRQQQVHHQSHNAQIVMAVPEQQVAPQPQDIIISGGGGGSFEPTSSSRWPKPEVLALIKLRSGLEPRYQEAGPKGPLWEEISAGMQRMGYKRSSKRCKEKWENINKYYKKVKESNKKRPEDAKTCPYFHQLDALYRRKILGGSSSTTGGSTFVNQNMPEQQQQQEETIKMDPISSTKPSPPQDTSDAPAAIMPQQTLTSTAPSENKNGASSTDVQAQASNVGHFGEGSIGGAPKKPEDIVKELMEHQRQQQLIVDDYDKIEEAESDNIDQEEEEEEEEDEDIEDEDEELKEERKMSYKIEFQRQNAGSSNGGGNGAASFLALVQ